MRAVLWVVYILAMIREISYGYYEGRRGNYSGMTVVWAAVLLSVVFMRELLSA